MPHNLINLITSSDSNSNCSYYYSNDNGSKYYNSGKGSATYTSPSGQTKSYSTNKWDALEMLELFCMSIVGGKSLNLPIGLS